MTDSDRLLEAWIDGTIEPRDAETLRDLLHRDHSLRRRLVSTAWLEADLVRHFSAAAPERRRPAWPALRPVLRWGLPLAAAAMLLLAWLLVRPSAGPELLEGRIAGTVALDRMLVVEKSAILRLDDGTRLRAPAGARLLVRPAEAGDRQAVELDRGEVRCAVVSAPERFRVVTRLGEVVAVGTEFTVRLQEAGMEVQVHHGRVRVVHGGAAIEMATGAKRWFGDPERQLVVQGRSAGVSADRILTVRSGDGGRSVRIPIDPSCTVIIDGSEGRIEDLPKQVAVEVVVDAQGRGQHLEAFGSRYRGVIASCDPGVPSLTLAAHGEAPARTWRLSDRARVLRDGSPVSLGELHPGQAVRVTSSTDGSVLTVIEAESKTGTR